MILLASIPTTLQALFGEYNSLVAYVNRLDALGLFSLSLAVWAAIFLIMWLISQWYK